MLARHLNLIIIPNNIFVLFYLAERPGLRGVTGYYLACNPFLCLILLVQVVHYW